MYEYVREQTRMERSHVLFYRVNQGLIFNKGVNQGRYMVGSETGLYTEGTSTDRLSQVTRQAHAAAICSECQRYY